jgi:hypothetical protein
MLSKLQAERVELLGGVVVCLLERLVALVASLEGDLLVFGAGRGGSGVAFRGQMHALGGQQFGHEAHALLVALEFAERLVVRLVQHVVHLFLEQRERERAHALAALSAAAPLTRGGSVGRAGRRGARAHRHSPIFGRIQNRFRLARCLLTYMR